MARGFIKTLTDKGYGFVRNHDTGEDHFFHAKDLSPELIFGESLLQMEVEFNPLSGARGPRAGDVRPAFGKQVFR